MLTSGALKALRRPKLRKPQPVKGPKKSYGSKMISARNKKLKKGY